MFGVTGIICQSRLPFLKGFPQAGSNPADCEKSFHWRTYFCRLFAKHTNSAPPKREEAELRLLFKNNSDPDPALESQKNKIFVLPIDVNL